MDIWLRKWVPPESAFMMLREQLPKGFMLLEVWQLPQSAPGLQAAVRRARYRCVAWHAGGVRAARDAAATFMGSESVLHEYVRGDETKSTDLRPLVHAVTVSPGAENWCHVDLMVSAGQEGSARPDHVLAVLGCTMPAESIHRVALLLEGQ